MLEALDIQKMHGVVWNVGEGLKFDYWYDQMGLTWIWVYGFEEKICNSYKDVKILQQSEMSWNIIIDIKEIWIDICLMVVKNYFIDQDDK